MPGAAVGLLPDAVRVANDLMILWLSSCDRSINSNPITQSAIGQPTCDFQTGSKSKASKQQPDGKADENLGREIVETEFSHFQLISVRA